MSSAVLDEPIVVEKIAPDARKAFNPDNALFAGFTIKQLQGKTLGEIFDLIGPEETDKEYVRLSQRFYPVAYGMTHDHGLAEDCLQNMFFKASQNRFDGLSTLETWLYRILVNDVLDKFRKAKCRPLDYVDLQNLSNDPRLRLKFTDESFRPEEQIGARENIKHLFEKITKDEATLYLLRYAEGFSVEEVAEITGMNESTLKVKIFRARQKMLKAQDNEEERFASGQLVLPRAREKRTGQDTIDPVPHAA